MALSSFLQSQGLRDQGEQDSQPPTVLAASPGHQGHSHGYEGGGGTNITWSSWEDCTTSPRWAGHSVGKGTEGGRLRRGWASSYWVGLGEGYQEVGVGRGPTASEKTLFPDCPPPILPTQGLPL